MLIAKLTTAVAISSLLFAGCSKKNSGSSAADSKKIRVGYIGLTCEAPIFMALEQGFFKRRVGHLHGLEAVAGRQVHRDIAVGI